MLFKKLLLAGVMFASLNVLAEAEYTGPAVPEKLNSGWELGIIIHGDYANNQGCQSNGAVRFSKDHPDYDTARALIMMAFAAQKQLKFYVDGCKGSVANAVYVQVIN